MSVMILGFRWRVVSRLVEMGVPVSVAFHIGERPAPADDPAPKVHGIDWRELYDTHSTAFDPHLDRTLAEEVRRTGFGLFSRSIMRDGRRIYWRNDSWLDIKNIFENSVQYLSGLIRDHNVDTILFSNGPHEGATVSAYYLARAMGLKTALTTQSRFPNAFWIGERFDELTLTGQPGNISADMPIVSDPPVPHDMKNIQRMSRTEYLAKQTWRSVNTVAKAASLSFLWNPRAFHKSHVRALMLRRAYRIQNLPQHYFSDPEPGEKYAYFPLHLQPEMTTDTFGGPYADQLLAIEELRRRLPDDHWIYLKENPKQDEYMREPSFFARMQAIPKVRYLPMTIPTLKLIRGCQMVATINGTAGWEALQIGKPVITFGVAWYEPLPGAFDWRKGPGAAMTGALGYRHDPAVLEAAVEHFRHGFWRGVVDKDYAELVPGYEVNSNDITVAESLVEYFDRIGKPLAG